MADAALNTISNVVPMRDAYGFAVRPQHLQRYREYSDIYRDEEAERTEKWNKFIAEHLEPFQSIYSKEQLGGRCDGERGNTEGCYQTSLVSFCGGLMKDDSSTQLVVEETQLKGVKSWYYIRPCFRVIEGMLDIHIRTKNHLNNYHGQTRLLTVDESQPLRADHDKDSDEEYFEDVIVDDTNSSSQASTSGDFISKQPSFPLKELEFLVHGGVPKSLRGEVWQAFVGVSSRRSEKYYESFLYYEDTKLLVDASGIPEKLIKQIEKDLHRTFPGHPALNEDGRNSLKRLLVAYARHNPSVGYCQAMNFFAGLLLLVMPEENAFWTLVGILGDYFDGYYSEEMIDSQVDQLVFEELMGERFPKLVNHLSYLGVEVAWISGPWFLSIFVNILPWECVLRVWDVLLFEGNRVMVFRTALALMDLYGPALVTTKDAGDAVTLLQSLSGSTFDSSQLVLTACMGFLAITESKLQQLRTKHRPVVLELVKQRKDGKAWKDSKGVASKLYSFKHGPESFIMETSEKGSPDDMSREIDTHTEISHPSDLDEFLNNLSDPKVKAPSDLQEQVVWLKVELCRLLEEKRQSTLRAEELETALMEMVKQDNRRQLSAKIERLEQDVVELHQSLSDKREQENQMLQVLMKVEHEQKLTEDARLCAEQDATAQRYAVHVLQEKYEKTVASLAQMEKRLVMAESVLEATIQYQSGQVRANASPRAARPEPVKKLGLLSRPFALGWLDKNKGKQESSDGGADGRT